MLLRPPRQKLRQKRQGRIKVVPKKADNKPGDNLKRGIERSGEPIAEGSAKLAERSPGPTAACPATSTRNICTSTSSLHLFDFPAEEDRTSEHTKKSDVSSGDENITFRSKLSKSALFSLFKSPSFITLLSGCMCGGIGFFVTLTHIVARGVHAGISRNDAAVLMTGLGIGGLVGRAGHGILIDKHLVERDVVFMGSFIISALVNYLNPLLDTFPTLCVYTVVLGVSNGTVSSLMFAMIRLQVTPDQAPLALAFGTFVFAASGMAGGVLAGM